MDLGVGAGALYPSLQVGRAKKGKFLVCDRWGVLGHGWKAQGARGGMAEVCMCTCVSVCASFMPMTCRPREAQACFLCTCKGKVGPIVHTLKTCGVGSKDRCTHMHSHRHEHTSAHTHRCEHPTGSTYFKHNTCRGDGHLVSHADICRINRWHVLMCVRVWLSRA